MRRLRGFTLIELLVVIAIISLLVSILLPSLNRAKALAQAVMCSTNQRNLGLAWRLYVQDHGGAIPYAVSGLPPDNVGQIAPYLDYEANVFEPGTNNYRADGGVPIPALFCPSVTSEVILRWRQPGFVGGSPTWPYSDYGINISASCNMLKSGTLGQPNEYWNWGDGVRTLDDQHTPADVIAYLDSVLAHVGIDLNWAWPYDYPNGKWYTEWGRYWGNPYVHGDQNTVNVVFMDCHVGQFTNEDFLDAGIWSSSDFQRRPWSTQFD